MAPHPGTEWNRLSFVAYAIAGMMLLFVVSDTIAVAWPLVPGEASWRYGVIGVVSGTLYLPFISLFIALSAGVLADHRAVVTVVAILSAGAALLMIALAGIFLLDFSSLRALADQGPNAGAFGRSGFQALFKLAVASITFLVMAVSGFRQMGATRKPKAKAGPSSIVPGPKGP